MSSFRTSLFALLLFCVPAAMFAQADAAASVSNTMPSNNFGFNLPTNLGTLSYALTASQMFEAGYGDGSVYATTALSGNLAYISKSDQNPFSAVYSGGLVFTGVPGSNGVETFQNISASQVFRTKAWSYVISDSFSYLPSSPTTGLSGVAGVGDVGIYPVQTGIGPTQDILTNYSSRISNGLDGSATWQASARLDIAGSANWGVLHFLGGEPGYDSDQYSATVGPSYRIDERNTVGAGAYYSRYTYPDSNYLIETEGANVNYSRAWTRRLNTSFSFGPALTHGTTTIAIPARWYMAGTASATYATRTTGFYAAYSRGVNAGSGVVLGALSDTVSGGMSKPINRDWSLGVEGNYSRSSELVPAGVAAPVYDSIFGGAQVSRRLTETLSFYGGYTAIWQSENSQVPNEITAFHGLNHIFSVGITFAPAPLISRR